MGLINRDIDITLISYIFDLNNVMGLIVVRSKSNLIALYINKLVPKSPNLKDLELVNLEITDNRYINDIVVPFLNVLTFLSKKRFDYQDWLTILCLRIKGHHLIKQVKGLIPLIVNNMNIRRLSTYRDKSRLPGADSEYINNRIKFIFNSPSNIVVLEDGRKKIKSTGTFVSTYSSVELCDYDGSFKVFNTQSDCANYLNVNRSTVSRRLVLGKKFTFNGGGGQKLIIRRRDVLISGKLKQWEQNAASLEQGVISNITNERYSE